MKVEINIILLLLVTMMSGLGMFVLLMAMGFLPNMMIGG